MLSLLQNSCSKGTSFPKMGNVTKIIVVTNEHKVIKNISDLKQISKIVAFIDAHREGWDSPLAGVPVPSVILEFYEGEMFKGHFGVGNDFFETQREGIYCSKSISEREEQEFLGLIEVDKELIHK